MGIKKRQVTHIATLRPATLAASRQSYELKMRNNVLKAKIDRENFVIKSF